MVTPHETYIRQVIDKALDFSNDYLRGLQEPTFLVPDEMIDHTKAATQKDIVFWTPTPANFPTEKFNEYESRIGYKLPDTYKIFLSYKYFISLNFGHDADFFRHTSSWPDNYYTTIIKNNGNEILNKGLIPFAHNRDQGYFCFDTNENIIDNDYKIVTYDRESDHTPYPFKKRQFTFIEFVQELDTTIDTWKKSKQTSA